METLFGKYKDPSQDLNRSQELGVFHNCQETQLQTSVVVTISS